MSLSSGSLELELSPFPGPVKLYSSIWQARSETPVGTLPADSIDEANEEGSDASPRAANPNPTPSATLPDWLVGAIPTIHSVIVDVVSVFRNVDAYTSNSTDSSSLPVKSASNVDLSSSQLGSAAGAPTPTGSSISPDEENPEGKESPQSEGQDLKEGDREESTAQSDGKEESTSAPSGKEAKSDTKEGGEEQQNEESSSSRRKSSSIEASQTAEGSLEIFISLPSESSSFPLSRQEPTGLITDSTPFPKPQDLGPTGAPSSTSELPTPSSVDSQGQEASTGSSYARYVILGVCLFVAVLFGAIILLIMRARKRRQRERYPTVSQLEKSGFTTIPDGRRDSQYTASSNFPTGRESRRTSTSSRISRLSTLAIVVPNPKMSSKSLPLAAQLTPTAPLNFTPRTSNPFSSPADDAVASRPSTPTESMYSQISAGTTMHNALNSRNKAPSTLMQLAGIAAPGPSRA